MSAVHRTYAQALFQAAKEERRLDVVRGELADFVGAVGEVPELRAVLRNPQVDARAKVRILEDLLGGADKLVRNFLLLAAEKGRIGDIDEVARAQTDGTLRDV